MNNRIKPHYDAQELLSDSYIILKIACKDPWYGDNDLTLNTILEKSNNSSTVKLFMEKHPKVKVFELVESKQIEDQYGDIYHRYVWRVDLMGPDYTFIKHCIVSGSHGSDHYEDPVEVVPETIKVTVYN